MELKWIDRFYETGVDRVVLYIDGIGYPWNGVTNITEQPSGGEVSNLYANNGVYLGLISNESISYNIQAYGYPEEFCECIGIRNIAPGVYISQQNHLPFGLSYRTLVGNDYKLDDYKIHIYYNCLCSPSENASSTINESTDVNTYDWSVNTIDEQINGFKPASKLVFDSRSLDPIYLHEIERIIYGSSTTQSTLPSINNLLHIFDEDYWYLQDSFGEYVFGNNNEYITAFGKKI